MEQMKQQTNPYSSGDDVMREGVRVCGGGDCRAAVPSQRQLVTHVATSQNNKVFIMACLHLVFNDHNY